MKHRGITVAGLLLAATLFATAPSAAAEDGPGAGGWDTDVAVGAIMAETDYVTIREGDGWTSFEYRDALSNAERRLHEGKRDGDVCVFSGSRTVSGESGTVSVEREIATNISSCLMVTEVGEIDALAVDSLEQEGGLEAQEVAVPITSDDVGQVAALASRSVWHRTRYVDPPGITVTRATTNVTWNYSGGCVTSSSGHVTNCYWAAATGWSKTSSGTTSSRNCAGATTRSNSYFSNSFFCIGNPTAYTQFTPNSIRGNPNGTFTANWSASKSGGCSSWLSFHSHTGS